MNEWLARRPVNWIECKRLSGCTVMGTKSEISGPSIHCSHRKDVSKADCCLEVELIEASPKTLHVEHT